MRILSETASVPELKHRRGRIYFAARQPAAPAPNAPKLYENENFLLLSLTESTETLETINILDDFATATVWRQTPPSLLAPSTFWQKTFIF